MSTETKDVPVGGHFELSARITDQDGAVLNLEGATAVVEVALFEKDGPTGDALISRAVDSLTGDGTVGYTATVLFTPAETRLLTPGRLHWCEIDITSASGRHTITDPVLLKGRGSINP